jgi:hypothetical protein
MLPATARSPVMDFESAQVAREFANLRDFETGANLKRMAHIPRD